MVWCAARGTYNVMRKTKINDDDDRISAKSQANLIRVKCAYFQSIFYRLSSGDEKNADAAAANNIIIIIIHRWRKRYSKFCRKTKTVPFDGVEQLKW